MRLLFSCDISTVKKMGWRHIVAQYFRYCNSSYSHWKQLQDLSADFYLN